MRRPLAATGPVAVESLVTERGAIQGEQPMNDAWNETHGLDGTDLTLIRWMLSLSPKERLEVLQASAGSLERLRELASTDS